MASRLSAIAAPSAVRVTQPLTPHAGILAILRPPSIRRKRSSALAATERLKARPRAGYNHRVEPRRPSVTPETIETAARQCFEMHAARTRYVPLDATLRRGSLDDAYRVQDALHRVMAKAGRGEIAGWKIALTSKAMQQMTGVDQPAAGAIFASVVHPSPYRLSVAAYHHLGVEFEVAVRLGADLPASGGPRSEGRRVGKG